LGEKNWVVTARERPPWDIRPIRSCSRYEREGASSTRVYTLLVKGFGFNLSYYSILSAAHDGLLGLLI